MCKKSAFLLVIIFVLGACNRKPDDVYRVVKIKDGDTIGLLSNDNTSFTVRFAEIDCPEKTQAFGQAAKKFTSDICFGKDVKLIGSTKDRYGRTVALVILTDGSNVNYQLVKNGFAWQYKAYSKNPELAALEQGARQNHLGLWHDANPIPPWEYRREKKPVYSNNKPDSLANTPVKKHRRKRKPKLEDAYY